MGVPPVRIEIMTTISGVSFEECYPERVKDELDGVEVNLISLKHLKINKKAFGRPKIWTIWRIFLNREDFNLRSWQTSTWFNFLLFFLFKYK